MSSKNDNVNVNVNVAMLCREMKVHESSYYAHLKSIRNKEVKRLKEKDIIQKIILIFKTRNRKYGARRVSMELNDWCSRNNINMVNLKRVRRIMKENKLVCTIRKKNPYKYIWRATKEHRVFNNLIDRKFKEGYPGERLLTDITYLHLSNGKRAYLSAIKDMITGEIVAHTVRDDLKIDLSIDVVTMLENKYYTDKTIIHSDQGCHYTSPQFTKALKNKGITQSMSRRGNCIDNSPMESFFGHFKDEFNSKDYIDLKSVSKAIDKYMIYYNTQRRQWTKNKLTPNEYRSQLLYQ